MGPPCGNNGRGRKSSARSYSAPPALVQPVEVKIPDFLVTVAAWVQEDGRTALVCTNMAGVEVNRFYTSPGASPDLAGVRKTLQERDAPSSSKLRIVTADGQELLEHSDAVVTVDFLCACTRDSREVSKHGEPTTGDHTPSPVPGESADNTHSHSSDLAGRKASCCALQ